MLFLAREEGAALGSLVLETNAGGFIVKVCLSPPAASPVTTPCVPSLSSASGAGWALTCDACVWGLGFSGYQ